MANNLPIILDFIEVLCSAAAVIVAVLVFKKTSIINKEMKDKDDDEMKKVRTIDAYNKLNEKVLSELYILKDKDIKEASNNPKSDDYKTLVSYLDYLDSFATLYNKNYYDQELINDIANSALNNSLVKISPMIEARIKNGKESNKDIYLRNLKEFKSSIRKEHENKKTINKEE